MNLRAFSLVLVLALIAAACGDDTTSAPTTVSTVTTTTTTASPATSAPTTSSAPPSQVDTEISRFIEAFGAEGDCIDLSYADGDLDYAAGVEQVPCDGAHDHEVFYVGTLAAGIGEPWPGEEAVAAEVFDDTCTDEFSDGYGLWDETFTLELWATYPLEEEWNAGLRTFKCSVTSVFNSTDGTPLLGSARSAGLGVPESTVLVVAEYDDRDLYLYSFDGDGSMLEVTNLTADTVSENTNIPAWSPDGSTVAFSQQDDQEQWDIWLLDVATGVKTQLMSDAPVDSLPVYSPDGSKILFTSRDRSDTERDIWVMDADGGNLIQLTTDPGTESSADWSPDGTQIVYRAKSGASNDIWIMNADGSDQRLLVDLGGDEYDPRWSPAGDRIAFISDVGGDFDIYLIPVGGGEAVNLTNHPADDEYPSWSPDGSLILFNSNRRGVQSLWVMRADGSAQSSLIDDYPVGWGAMMP